MIQEIIMYVYKGMVTTLTAYTYPYIYIYVTLGFHEVLLKTPDKRYMYICLIWTILLCIFPSLRLWLCVCVSE